jgi:trk system potassium uptake protein TrkH
MSQLNIRFIFKMLGLMFILEFLFVLVAIAVAFYYKGDDVYPLSQTAGIMLALGMLFYLIGFKANERYAGRREGMILVV